MDVNLNTRGSIFTDIATAVKVTGEIRKARKAGADAVQVKPAYTVPMLKTTYWTWTMEGCLMRGGDAERAVIAVFNSFDKKTKHALTFAPKGPGEWAERARFWQQVLEPALPHSMYHAVMIRFISWYAHCLRMEKGAAV